MTSIRRVRKAFKRKYGIKTFSCHINNKNSQYRPFYISPTFRRKLRRVFTEKMRISFKRPCTSTKTDGINTPSMI